MRHVARKRFGQNFLHDPAIIASLVAAIGPDENDFFVEIGPGKGALTEPLLQSGAHVEVVEIDRDLAARWQTRAALLGNLRVHCADALKFDFAAILPPGRAARLVGNLPYNISTPLLFRMAAFAERIRDAHVMLQKEVVDRMCAGPGNKTYGRLTVMLAPHFAIERVQRIGAGAFSPPPKVESAFVRLTPHSLPPFAVPYPKAFATIVAMAFSMRRKTLRNSLKSVLDGDTICDLGIDPAARPETLTPAQFACLAERAAHDAPDLR